MEEESNIKFPIREQWLSHAAELINEMVFGYKSPEEPGLYGRDLSDLKISCGFPLGSRGSATKLGQCLDSSTSESGMTEIYISPAINDSVQVLGTLHHELLHYVVGVNNGHNRHFRRAMLLTGLRGKPTSTYPNSGTLLKYTEIHSMLGDYPHSKVTIPERGSVGSNLIKVYCFDCGYTARTTKKWIDKYGSPWCPVHRHSMIVEKK